MPKVASPGRASRKVVAPARGSRKRPIVAPPAPRIVGILHSGAEDQHRGQIAALIRGLAEAGYVDGDDIMTDPLWADDDRVALRNNADILVGRVDVLVAAGGSASAVAAQAAANAANPADPKKIVFTTVADPVASGLVTSLDRPGGNLTGTSGLTSELDAKRLELLQELRPGHAMIGVLINQTRPQFAGQFQELQAAAVRLGLNLTPQNASTPNAINNAFAAFAGAGVGSVLVTADPLFNNQRKRVVRLARTRNLPAIYQWREFVAAGGLMSYGPSLDEAYHQAGVYAGRILDGDSPQNLPVMLPKVFELVINLRTAHQLRNAIVGFKVPGSMLARAVLLRRK